MLGHKVGWYNSGETKHRYRKPTAPGPPGKGSSGQSDQYFPHWLIDQFSQHSSEDIVFFLFFLNLRLTLLGRGNSAGIGLFKKSEFVYSEGGQWKEAEEL